MTMPTQERDVNDTLMTLMAEDILRCPLVVAVLMELMELITNLQVTYNHL